MNRPIVQAVLLVLIASVIAVVANAVAGRERKLVLPGYYPNALRVPERAPAKPAAPPVVATPQPVTATVAPAVAPTATTVTTTTVAPVVPAPKKPQPPAVTRQFLPHPDKAFEEIGYAEAAHLHSKGALFLDARRTSVFEDGHIAGSRPFSVWESDVDDKVNKLFEERPDPDQQNLPIVIYCSGGACEDSHMLAQKLWGIQFNNVYVYKDGYPDWVTRGGPTRKGATP
ncbi:MAG TPA: rhodanese-like domain-containing protein [Thermoanaerobaculia bacterium]|nr:rhodanese-like domain-containing protein [Thermoanaerobaculia bacterium]